MFDPDDGGNVFCRDIEPLLIFMALRTRRPSLSQEIQLLYASYFVSNREQTCLSIQGDSGIGKERGETTLREGEEIREREREGN
jgi:hypothetical protein